MDPASPKRSRSRETVADVPQKPSRGHCGDGLLHRADTHIRCCVLLFRHRPRPAYDSTFQRDAKSQCSLGSPAIARSLGLPTAARVLAIRSRRKVSRPCDSAVREIGSEPTRAAFGCPWQNGVAERWVGSCRRDLLGHVIILNERHLKRLMSSCLLYYHEDRTHLGMVKDTPAGRATEIRSAGESKIQFLPRLGALHHRYAVAAQTQELFF
jgi:transposase InsO family protein